MSCKKAIVFLLLVVSFSIFPAGDREMPTCENQTIGLTKIFEEPKNGIFRFGSSHEEVFCLTLEENLSAQKVVIAKYIIPEKRWVSIFDIEDFPHHNRIASFSVVSDTSLMIFYVSRLPDSYEPYGRAFRLSKKETEYEMSHVDVPPELLLPLELKSDRVFLLSDNYPSYSDVFGNALIYNAVSKEQVIIEYPLSLKGEGKLFWGRTQEEFIVARVKRNDFIRLFFFDRKNQTIEKRIEIPSTYTGNNVFGSVLASPDGQYLAISHFAYGLWLIDLNTEEMLTVVEVGDESNSGTTCPVNLLDWSWDSMKILFSVETSVFLLDVKRFLSANPKKLRIEME